MTKAFCWCAVLGDPVKACATYSQGVASNKRTGVLMHSKLLCLLRVASLRSHPLLFTCFFPRSNTLALLIAWHLLRTSSHKQQVGWP